MLRATRANLATPPHLQQGFTLLEVIASLLIVSVALAALTPVFALVAWRRGTSARIELATQLALSEIDRVRSIVDLELTRNPQAFLDPTELARLPNPANNFPNVPPPGTVDLTLADGQIDNSNNDSDEGYSIQLVTIETLDGRSDFFVVQSFRSPGDDCIDRRLNEVIENVPCSFGLGVRVYHRFSFDPDTGEPRPGLAQNAFSAFQSQSDGNIWRFPMASNEVEINLAADLGAICRGISTDLSTQCLAFPAPTPTP